MIWINKGKEPQEWTERCSTPNVKYEAIPELREALLREQGYICAYCMRRIPATDNGVDATSKIEHILSRENHPDLQMQYSNMVICCPGCIDGENLHCDASKGEKDIKCSPLKNDVMHTIRYMVSSAEIKSTNEEYNTELNNILCLNNSLLKQNRKEAWDSVCRQLSKVGWNSTNVRRALKHFREKDNNGKFSPYCGIIIYFLEIKLRKLEK